MRFKRNVQRYGRTPEVSTPYARAGQAWDERLGSARVQAKNWRLMALGSVVLSLTLSSGLAWTSTQSRVTPYVVEVDKLGQAQAITKVTTQFDPTDAQISWHIGRYIANVRGRSLDAVVMRENWLSAYDFSTSRAAQFLNDYARAVEPFRDVGQRTVMVQVTSVVRASDTSYRVNWTELSYERGAFAGNARWTAILTIVQKTPRNADILRRNPLGIYIDAVDWSRELEVNVSRGRPSSAAIKSHAPASPFSPIAPLGPANRHIPLGSPLAPVTPGINHMVEAPEGISS